VIAAAAITAQRQRRWAVVVTLPHYDQAPLRLAMLDGNCGVLAAWGALKHFRRRTSVDRLIRACGWTRRYGVFTIALATALHEHGLTISFHSDRDPNPKPLERRFYRKARRMKIPLLPAISISSLAVHVRAGRLPILFHDTPNGQGHFSPLTREHRGILTLPYSEGGRMRTTQLARLWNAAGICRQCVLVHCRR
jgi:hypothetical protein